MSLGSFIMPTVTTYLRDTNFTLVMLLIDIVVFISFLLMLFMSSHYKAIFVKSAFTRD